MGALMFKYNTEHSVIIHPLDQELPVKGLIVTVEHSQVSNDLIQISDTLDSSLKI